MAQDGRARVLVVEELVEEQVDARSERVEGEVPDVFREDEEGEGDREGHVREGGLEEGIGRRQGSGSEVGRTRSRWADSRRRRCPG